MLRFLRQWRTRRLLAKPPVPPELIESAIARAATCRRLDAEERARLRDSALLFLHAKRIQAAGGLALDDAMRATLAVQACLPVLNLGLDWYRGWSSLILYPAEFVTDHEEVDEDGVVHLVNEPRSGEAWSHGPVILSWEDVAASGFEDGYNVVIHELAHKLDGLDGSLNGLPPLHAGMNVRDWSLAFSAAYADLQARADAGEDTLIDPYGAEAPEEFFAVASEYFFELPEVLRDAYPDVYRQLAAFYRVDPVAGQRGGA